MTVQSHHAPRPHIERLPKTPKAIREALSPEDRAAFEEQFHAAVRRFDEVFDIGVINDLVEAWWPLAVFSQDPQRKRRAETDAARLLAGDRTGFRPVEEAAAEYGWPTA